MGLDELCSSDQWSMLSSASDLSKLAAALGAFLVTAIALYLKGEVRESVHTMALFSSAVLILVLSAFVFSLLTGTAVAADGDRREICATAWTQGTLAIGMLSVGATALFGGLGWMLAGHAEGRMAAHAGKDHSGYEFLARLGSWLTFAAAMSTTLMLSETTIDFVHFMVGSPDGWFAGVIAAAAAAVVLVSLFSILRRSSSAGMTLQALKVATVGVVALGVVASWMAMSLPRLPNDWLVDPGAAIVGAVVTLSFVVPGVIAMAICYSAPRATSA